MMAQRILKILAALLMALFLCGGGCGDSSAYTPPPSPPPAPPPPPPSPVSPFTSADPFVEELTAEEFLTEIFERPYSPRTRLYLPNYAYTQGLVYARGKVGVFGQVRVIGGTASPGPDGDTRLGFGAMITASPQYVTPRATPRSPRLHIASWKERSP